MKRFKLFFAIVMIASVALAGTPKRLTKSELLGVRSEQTVKSQPKVAVNEQLKGKFLSEKSKAEGSDKRVFAKTLDGKSSMAEVAEGKFNLTGRNGYAPKHEEVEESYELITPPAGLQTSTYKVNGFSFAYWEDQTFDVKIGFDGDEIYIQGLLHLQPEAWIKGTRDGSQYVFEMGQYLGSVHLVYEEEGWDLGYFDTWLAATTDMKSYCDLVLDYDEAADRLTAHDNMDVLFYNDRTFGFLETLRSLVINNAHEYDNISYDLVTPPVGMTYEPVEGTYFSLVNNKNITFTAFMGLDGNDIYLNGLTTDMPGTWVKGTIAEDGTVTFAKGQYIGKYLSVYDMWMMGVDPATSELCDVVAEWNASSRTLTFDENTWIVENSDPVRLSFLDVMEETVINPLPDGTTLVMPPSGLEVKSYAASVNSVGGYSYANSKYNVNIAFDGDDVYMQGLFYYSPMTWIKGRREGDVLTFDKNQYIGYVMGHEVYVLSCDDDDNVYDNFSFTYDADKDAYTSDAVICFTIAPDDTNSIEIIYNVSLNNWDNVAVYDTNVITSAPAGNVVTYKRKGDAYYTFMGFLVDGNQNGNIIEITTASDGKTVYMQDPISMAKTEEPTWIKGEIGEDGKIHVPLFQCIMYSEEYQYGLATAQFVKGEVDGVQTYVLDTATKEITFTVGENGIISLDGFDYSSEGAPEKLYGLVYTDDDAWSGFGDFNTRYIVFDDEVTTLPDGLETKAWALMYNDGVYDSNRIVQVSDTNADGKVYIQGLFDVDPDAVVVGELADNVLTIKSDQYLGMFNGLTIFFAGATYESYVLHDDETGENYNMFRYTYLPEIKFNLDAENDILTTAEGNAIVLNAGEAVDYFVTYEVAHEPRFSIFKAVAAKPADPEVIGFSDWFDGYGYNMISFNVKSEDVDGNYIDTNQLCYILWVKEDGVKHPYVFSADYYYGFEQLGIETMTEVPYYLVSYDEADWEDISVGGSTIVLYESGFDDYGIQSIYYGGGVRNESNIVWLSGNVETGIQNNVARAKTAGIFDINGRQLTTASRGINIVRMSDGTVRKVLVK